MASSFIDSSAALVDVHVEPVGALLAVGPGARDARAPVPGQQLHLRRGAPRVARGHHHAHLHGRPGTFLQDDNRYAFTLFYAITVEHSV